MWMQFSIFSVTFMRYMYLHRKKKYAFFLLKLDIVLFTAVYAALKIVLNQYLLSEYFHN